MTRCFNNRLLALLILAPTVLSLDLQSAEVRVHLVDHRKKAVKKADCRLVNAESGETMGAAVDSKGTARFSSVSPGTYQVFAESEAHLTVKSEFFKVGEKDSEIKLVLPEEEVVREFEKSADVAFENQDYMKAAKLYVLALELVPWEATIRANLALSYVRLGQAEEARELARQGAAFDPKEFEVREKEVMAWISFEEGRGHLEQQNFEKAQAAFAAAIEANPNNDEAHYALALAYGHQHLYKNALQSIDEAIRLKPGAVKYTQVKEVLENNAKAMGQR